MTASFRRYPPAWRGRAGQLAARWATRSGWRGKLMHARPAAPLHDFALQQRIGAGSSAVRSSTRTSSSSRARIASAPRAVT